MLSSKVRNKLERGKEYKISPFQKIQLQESYLILEVLSHLATKKSKIQRKREILKCTARNYFRLQGIGKHDVASASHPGFPQALANSTHQGDAFPTGA